MQYEFQNLMVKENFNLEVLQLELNISLIPVGCWFYKPVLLEGTLDYLKPSDAPKRTLKEQLQLLKTVIFNPDKAPKESSYEERIREFIIANKSALIGTYDSSEFPDCGITEYEDFSLNESTNPLLSSFHIIESTLQSANRFEGMKEIILQGRGLSSEIWNTQNKLAKLHEELLTLDQIKNKALQDSDEYNFAVKELEDHNKQIQDIYGSFEKKIKDFQNDVRLFNYEAEKGSVKALIKEYKRSKENPF